MTALSLSDSILTRARTSPNALVRDLSNILSEAGVLARELDGEFHYRQMSSEVFKAKAQDLNSHQAFNRLYWRDTASTIKAYTLSAVYRSLDLSHQMCELLNSGGILGPAILARSQIELVSVFILTAASVRGEVAEASGHWNDKVVLSEKLETLLGKALFGTRTVPEGDPFRQTNILTHIKRLSKNPGFEYLGSCYERLCEVAHPNALGNARFWADGGSPQADGTVLWTGGPQVVSTAMHEIMDDTLWVLAWCTRNTMIGFTIADEQIARIASVFP